MKRAVLFAACSAALCAAALLLVPDLQAKAFDCLNKDACKPIPCEIMAELKYTRAEIILYSGSEAPKGMTAQEWGRSSSAALQKARDEYVTCGSTHLIDGNKLSTTSCKLESAQPGGAPLTKEESLKNSSTCSELVEADWMHSQAQLAFCLPESVGAKATAEGRRQNALNAAINREATLEHAIKNYWSSCAPNAQQAQELFDLGLNTLLVDAKIARTKWQASRSQSSPYDPNPVFDLRR